MSTQFENPNTTKVKDEKIPDATAEKNIQEVADKAAEKSSKTEQKYDKNHGIISK